MAEYSAEDELLPAYNRLNEPTFSELARARAGGGFAKLGHVIGSTLAGGGVRDARGVQVFQQAAKSSASTADILMQARQRRDAEIGRQAAAKELQDKGDSEGANIVLNSTSADQAQQALLRRDQLKGLGRIGSALQGVGYSPQQAELGSAMFSSAGGSNPENSIKALLTGSLGAGPSTPAVPQTSQVLSHALQPDSTRISDGYVYDTTAPATQSLQATPIANARAAEITQLGGEHAAQARAADALAAKRNLPGTDVNGVPVAPVPTTGLGDATVASGDEFIKTLDPARAIQVKALAEGRMAFPSGFALKTPYWQQMLSDVAQYDPEFDAVNYNKRSQTANAFAKGKQGDAVRAVNQTLSHMGSLGEAMDKLDNFNGVATPLNYLKNTVQSALGDPRQGTFTQKVQAVSSELRKVFQASGGGSLEELKQWERSFPLNASHEQQQAYLKSGVQLLQGAIDALQEQKIQGMGHKVGSASIVSPQAQPILDRLSGHPSAGYKPGDVVVVHGRKFVVKGGDPNDPDLEPAP